MDIINWQKGFSGKTGFLLEYITIHRSSTKFKIRFFFHLKPNHKPTLCLKHEEIKARKRGIWGMNVINSAVTTAHVTKMTSGYWTSTTSSTGAFNRKQ